MEESGWKRATKQRNFSCRFESKKKALNKGLQQGYKAAAKSASDEVIDEDGKRLAGRSGDDRGRRCKG